MDTHKTYKKESVLGEDKEEAAEKDKDAKKDSFIWTFMVRPVHDEGRKWGQALTRIVQLDENYRLFNES